MSATAEDLSTQILRQGTLDGCGTQPVVLTKVEVNGGDAFLREFFGKLLAPLADQSDYTLAQLMQQTEASFELMRKTEVFAKIAPSFHVDYLHPVAQSKRYNKDQAIATRVVFDVEAGELSHGAAALGFNTQDNLVVDLGYTHRNFNHNAEQVQIGVNYRPYKPAEQLELAVRLVLALRNPAYKFVAEGGSAHHNHPACAVARAQVGVAFLDAARAISSFHGVAVARRTIDAGDFLKSSLVSRVAYSTVRHVGGVPRTGVAASFSGEVSSDQEQKLSDKLAFFVKAAARAQWYHTWGAVTAHVFGEGGAVYAPQTNLLGVHVADRFYLGGIGSLSGFARHAVNPAGGAQYYKAGATLLSRVPGCVHRLAENPLRMYATAAVADVGDRVTAGVGVTSAGVGLRYFNEWVNLDAGYFVALRPDRSATGVRDGFQLELSLGGTTAR